MQNLPNLPVYNAYKPYRSEGGGSIALIFAILLVPITLGVSYAMYDNHQKGIYGNDASALVFPLIVIGLLVLLNFWLFRVYLRAKKRINAVKKQFKEKGVSTSAKIIGKERVDGGESADDYYVYYQFKSDFIVKADLLNSKEKAYYNLPIGATIEIEYLSDNPTQSRLK
ncbi:MAG: hypothetical protein HC913_22345 [Microscillaceae bacterium]|nr:hypothetical protein [Microscillaceae bacterium]